MKKNIFKTTGKDLDQKSTVDQIKNSRVNDDHSTKLSAELIVDDGAI